MKLLKLLPLAIIIAMFAFACSKVNPVAEQMQKQGAAQRSIRTSYSNLRYQLIDLPNLEMVMAFRELTNAEKCGVWMDKMDAVLTEEILTQAQRDFINTKKDLLVPSLYDELMSDEATNAFMIEAEQYFTEAQVVRIFGLLYDMNQEIPVVDRPNEPGDGRPECECLWSAGCGIPLGFCEKTLCDPQNGCGIWGTSSCTGMCNRPHGPDQAIEGIL